ncbi:hypothetical protein AWC38_SpisGene18533 [Stylophora pistillata]|uniref:Uromodulin n=1 Tax=Stylophora pistillata TaxID=50429 RepID=A0A2B4RFK9_STYPI|nr:hypothetical protein AWC38_SpisGene18533 [Stylophora pistillata]
MADRLCVVRYSKELNLKDVVFPPKSQVFSTVPKKNELGTMKMHFLIVIALCYVHEDLAQQCKRDGHAFFGMMLQRHTFRTMKSSIAVECHQACNNDFRCHSFNYVISEELCELNNRTKEARPESFVPNSERYYVKSNKKRVPLGSIPELPAETCKEIKASEEGRASSGNYWLDSIIKGKAVLVPCDMETEDADECQASLPVCDTNAICQNTPDSYICVCKPGIADGKTCTARTVQETETSVSLRAVSYEITIEVFEEEKEGLIDSIMKCTPACDVISVRKANGQRASAALGSIPELPAKNCIEIKLSEGEQAVSGKYWYYNPWTETAKLAYCDMKTEDVDECEYDLYYCEANIYCSNTVGSYICTSDRSVLFYIEAWNRIHGKLSCTQVKCTWLIPNDVDEVTYAAIEDINFKSASKRKQ